MGLNPPPPKKKKEKFCGKQKQKFLSKLFQSNIRAFGSLGRVLLQIGILGGVGLDVLGAWRQSGVGRSNLEAPFQPSARL